MKLNTTLTTQPILTNMVNGLSFLIATKYWLPSKFVKEQRRINNEKVINKGITPSNPSPKNIGTNNGVIDTIPKTIGIPIHQMKSATL